jgi:YggT family protein
MIVQTIHLFFLCYTMMLFIRIIGSWFPNLRQHKFMHFVMYYTEPYLGFFRKIIPPIGGVLDLSPILGFFALRLFEQLFINFFR